MRHEERDVFIQDTRKFEWSRYFFQDTSNKQVQMQDIRCWLVGNKAPTVAVLRKSKKTRDYPRTMSDKTEKSRRHNGPTTHSSSSTSPSLNATPSTTTTWSSMACLPRCSSFSCVRMAFVSSSLQNRRNRHYVLWQYWYWVIWAGVRG